MKYNIREYIFCSKWKGQFPDIRLIELQMFPGSSGWKESRSPAPGLCVRKQSLWELALGMQAIYAAATLAGYESNVSTILVLMRGVQPVAWLGMWPNTTL